MKVVRLTKMFMRRLWRARSGASLVEYSVLVGVTALLIVVAVAVAGSWAYGSRADLPHKRETGPFREPAP